MSRTKYIKVAVSERLPTDQGMYMVTFKNNKVGKFNFWNEPAFKESWLEHVDYWLEEIPDREEEMKAMMEELKLNIENSKKEASQSAESFDKREMEVSHYCSKAIETAYGICLKKIDSLLKSLKD